MFLLALNVASDFLFILKLVNLHVSGRLMHEKFRFNALNVHNWYFISIARNSLKVIFKHYLPDPDTVHEL